MASPKHAFTLVELAIVLVILGLLVGGVMTGQALIRAAELRAINNEFGKHKTAVHSFLDRYLSLPGDSTKAQKFWGVLNADPATCDITPANGGDTATCNGNGDDMVGLSGGWGYEPLRMWQHLANAGLVEGAFIGTGSPAPGYQVAAGKNVPRSRFPNGAWCVRWQASGPGGANHFDSPNSGHAFVFGADSSAEPCEAPVLSPEDALNVDSKIDDGRPATGSVQALWRATCANATSASDREARYRATITQPECALVYRKAF